MVQRVSAAREACVPHPRRRLGLFQMPIDRRPTNPYDLRYLPDGVLLTVIQLPRRGQLQSDPSHRVVPPLVHCADVPEYDR